MPTRDDRSKSEIIRDRFRAGERLSAGAIAKEMGLSNGMVGVVRAQMEEQGYKFDSEQEGRSLVWWVAKYPRGMEPSEPKPKASTNGSATASTNGSSSLRDRILAAFADVPDGTALTLDELTDKVGESRKRLGGNVPHLVNQGLLERPAPSTYRLPAGAAQGAPTATIERERPAVANGAAEPKPAPQSITMDPIVVPLSTPQLGSTVLVKGLELDPTSGEVLIRLQNGEKSWTVTVVEAS